MWHSHDHLATHNSNITSFLCGNVYFVCGNAYFMFLFIYLFIFFIVLMLFYLYCLWAEFWHGCEYVWRLTGLQWYFFIMVYFYRVRAHTRVHVKCTLAWTKQCSGQHLWTFSLFYSSTYLENKCPKLTKWQICDCSFIRPPNLTWCWLSLWLLFSPTWRDWMAPSRES